MNSSKRKMKTRGILLPVMVVLCVVCLCAMFLNSHSQRLSESEISALRNEYPIYGNVNLFHGSMKAPTLREVKENVDTFVYGTVEGDASTFSRSLSTGNAALDEKRKENGINDTFEYDEYTISVIADTAGIYKVGDKISIASPKEFADLSPALSEGMEIVVPTTRDKEKSDRGYYSVFGMYYVTDKQYALSAFDESPMMETAMSGVTVEQLMKELKR